METAYFLLHERLRFFLIPVTAKSGIRRTNWIRKDSPFTLGFSHAPSTTATLSSREIIGKGNNIGSLECTNG